MDMDIKGIILTLLEVDLERLNEAVSRLFAELQTEYDNNTDYIEKCNNFIPVLNICKNISSRADAIQEMGEAQQLFEEFLVSKGTNMEDLKDNDNN